MVVDANQRDHSWWDFASGNNVVETDFDIKVPRRTQLDLSVFSSPVSVTGVEGPHKVHGFSSPLVLNDIAGLPSGAYLQRIGHHPAEVVGIQSDRSTSRPSAAASSSTSRTAAQGTVTFNSFSGRLTSEMPLTMQSSSRRALKAELGSGDGGTLRFKTFSGNVKIDR